MRVPSHSRRAPVRRPRTSTQQGRAPSPQRRDRGWARRWARPPRRDTPSVRRALSLTFAFIVAACAPVTAPGITPVPSMTEFVIPTASPKPSPTRYTGHYGFLVSTPSGFAIRREDATTTLGTIDLDPIAVAPDGRFVAGWTKSGTELQIREVQAPTAIVRSAKLAPNERAGFVTWSVDEAGLLFSVLGPTWSALRTLDVTSPTASPKEVLRFDGVTLRPVVW